MNFGDEQGLPDDSFAFQYWYAARCGMPRPRGSEAKARIVAVVVAGYAAASSRGADLQNLILDTIEAGLPNGQRYIAIMDQPRSARLLLPRNIAAL